LSKPRSLFRQEAIDAQREKLLGEVSQARPVPVWVFTTMAAGMAAALVAFAFLGEYQRRERVDGYLAPDQGEARVSAPEGGVVRELLVKEGEAIAKDQPIARLKQERIVNGENTSTLMRLQLQSRLDSLAAEAEQASQMASQQTNQARKRIDDLKKQLVQSGHEEHAQQQRLESAQQELARVQQLLAEGFASAGMVRDRQNDVLDQNTKLESLRTARAAVERDLRSTETELPQITLRMETQRQQIEGRRGEVQQELLRETSNSDAEVRAPIAGTVTNISVTQGASVPANANLATIMPEGSGLHAQLLVPTRAIGFIEPGNAVVLRYDAFPFQRFGQYHGTVRTVGRTVFSPGEKVGALTLREPAYRIEVALDAQSVRSGAQEIPLRAGMLVNADILLEKRTVFEWVFEPVLALRERLR